MTTNKNKNIKKWKMRCKQPQRHKTARDATWDTEMQNDYREKRHKDVNRHETRENDH